MCILNLLLIIKYSYFFSFALIIIVKNIQYKAISNDFRELRTANWVLRKLCNHSARGNTRRVEGYGYYFFFCNRCAYNLIHGSTLSFQVYDFNLKSQQQQNHFSFLRPRLRYRRRDVEQPRTVPNPVTPRFSNNFLSS